MNDLTRGAQLAWKIAAAEAAGSRRPMIDKPQLLLGLLSLGKALSAATDLEGAERRELEDERALVEGVFARLSLQAVVVRRAVRQRVGVGAARHAPGATISRTQACKVAFERAAEMAGDAPAACLHLLAALFERPDPHLDLLLRDAGVRPDDVAHEARLRVLLRALARDVRARLGVEVVFDPRAEALLSDRGRGDGALERVVRQFVGEPLAQLETSGKLARVPRWRVAEDQGGLYVIPA